MSAPTQAQKKAAAKAIDKEWCEWQRTHKVTVMSNVLQDKMAEAALTAAARVGISDEERKMLDEASVRVIRRDGAQVGNKLSEKDERPDIEAILKARGNIKAATIERCAMVCDEAANDPRATKEYRYFCINMAAAIRKLKDEP